MKQHKLGNTEVSAIGLGCMNVSWIFTNGAALDPVRRIEEALPAFHSALDAGITLLDTADIYAPTWDAFGHNEIFVAEALRTWSAPKEKKDKVVIATKAGITRGPGETWGRSANLNYLLRAAEASAGRLGVDKIALWQHHRQDPSLEFETQVENLLVLKERGIIDQLGVSNYDAPQLEKAIEIAGKGVIVSIQNEFSPRYRYDLDVLEVCEKNDITFLPWSPLGGSRQISEITGSSAFEEIGKKHGASPYATALAWLMKYSPAVLPIPGATRTASILDCVSALEINLSGEDFEYLSANLPEQAEYSQELLPKPPHRK
jgi:aryl-alcohol dehydrogenase-like predicted oxidoreductase